uniref:Glycosyltransferase family 92 protein n=1 Tax=Parascaris univalens TaxID=6257 RepID=A0A915AP46_PARUN
MRLYVKYIAFVTCFFLFWVCFLATRFNTLHVDIANIAGKLPKEAHALFGNNNDPLVPLQGSDKRVKLTVSEAGDVTLQRHSAMTAVKFRNLSDSVLFYSSFVDYRDGNMGYPYVRTILLKQVSYTVQLSCRFGETLVEGSLYELAENHQQKYSTFIFSCKIPESVSVDEIQDWILTDGSNSAILQATYRIRREESIRAYNYDYSICLPFLYGSMYEGKHLAEFAELNKLLGAQRITLYTLKNSLAKSLQKALDYYTEERLIEVIEYDLPVKDIWYHGQLITVTDCLYR